MDQQEHDLRMLQRRGKLEKGSKKRLEALLKVKNADSSRQSLPEPLDPIESALRNHPGLTEEEAMAIAKAHGF